MRALALLVLLGAGVARAAAPEPIPEQVVIGFFPSENAMEQQASANELARMLADRLHLPVRAYVALDYTALVEAMHSGQVQFGWLTPAPLVLAERLFNAEILLTQVRRGSPTYFAALVVRGDSGITRVEDLRGKTIAWVDPQSTSGYVIPRYLLLQRGLDPQRFFRQQVFAGGHDSAVLALRSGQVDVAAVWADPPAEGTGAWTRFLGKQSGVRPILYSPPIPSDAVAVDPRFSAAHPLLVRSVRAALIAIGGSEEGRAILIRLNSTDGFVPATRDQYEMVRRAFEASRAGAPARFERPLVVAAFALLVLLGAIAALPWWRRLPRVRRGLGWTLLCALVLWGVTTAHLSLSRLYTGRAAMWQFVNGMFPPDRAVIPAVIESTIITIQLALLGTVLAVPVALLCGFLAAENVVRSRALRGAIRFALNFDRSIDTLIVALILVSAVGLGPLPGVVALALQSVGGLGKVFYETIETLDPGPPEALRSVGATRLQELRWGLWPQFAPHFVSILLFRFELNVRVSTVLGLVGAGGIGFLLITYMRGAEYAKVTAVIAAIVVLVMALDGLSTRLRRSAN
jgi:phosphonate ABC transporter permease subunit PhnE